MISCFQTLIALLSTSIRSHYLKGADPPAACRAIRHPFPAFPPGSFIQTSIAMLFLSGRLFSRQRHVFFVVASAQRLFWFDARRHRWMHGAARPCSPYTVDPAVLRRLGCADEQLKALLERTPGGGDKRGAGPRTQHTQHNTTQHNTISFQFYFIFQRVLQCIASCVRARVCVCKPPTTAIMSLCALSASVENICITISIASHRIRIITACPKLVPFATIVAGPGPCGEARETCG
jgi:hypothetical protein